MCFGFAETYYKFSLRENTKNLLPFIYYLSLYRRAAIAPLYALVERKED